MQKKQLKELYCNRKFSMMEIARELNVTHAKVHYWFKKFNIARRSQTDSAYIKQNPKGDPFKILKKLSAQDSRLLMSGLLLYWAEGNKGKDGLKIANLDQRMLLVFLNFLRKICQIDESRLFIYVRVYKKFSLNEAKNFWAKYLNVDKNKVYVYTHTDSRSKENNQWSMKGLATLEFHNTKIKLWLDKQTDKLIESLIKH